MTIRCFFSAQVSDDFTLNFNKDNPYSDGVKGLIKDYVAAIQKVQLYGPTNFSPIIRKMTEVTREIPQV